MKLSNKDKLIIIDMINGFVHKGPLSSKNVKNLVPKMSNFIKNNIHDGIEIYHYTDSHPVNCNEFKVFPPHCIQNTYESEVITELKFNEIEIIHKNSTNGFLAKNPFGNNIKNLYIIGCVTDICIYDFAYTAIKYVHEKNLNVSINVIENLCATFDAPDHDSKIVHSQTINKLKQSGINIISI
ncbi:MAG: cysteine hydrolase family protein [Bacilli bacterium]